MCKLFDAHNHLHLETVAIRGTVKSNSVSGKHHPRAILEHLRQNRIRSATCATREEDWNFLHGLRNDFPETLFIGLGIHPWWCDQISSGWDQRLRDILKENPDFFIGECGLDAFRAARHSGVSLQKQVEVLETHLGIAHELQRPVVLHCVRAWKYMRPILKQCPSVRFAIHRFRGPVEEIRDILNVGGYLSLHRDCLEQPSMQSILPQVNRQKILIETDYDGPRFEALPIDVELRENAKKIAALINLHEELVADLTRQNAEKFYGLRIL